LGDLGVKDAGSREQGAGSMGQEVRSERRAKERSDEVPRSEKRRGARSLGLGAKQWNSENTPWNSVLVLHSFLPPVGGIFRAGFCRRI
jgi:hypothetical protein